MNKIKTQKYKLIQLKAVIQTTFHKMFIKTIKILIHIPFAIRLKKKSGMLGLTRESQPFLVHSLLRKDVQFHTHMHQTIDKHYLILPKTFIKVLKPHFTYLKVFHIFLISILIFNFNLFHNSLPLLPNALS